MKKKLISVIIPGYNEGAIIAGTIDSVEKALVSLKKPFEILIVDDRSNDNTVQILQRLVKSKKHPNLRYVSYKDGPSRRENLAKSFKLLRGDYVLLLDMDLAMDLKHLGEMVYWLDHGYEVVLGSRYVKGAHIKRKPSRFLISRLYNLFIRVFFRTHFKDNICGFKAFKRNIILRLVNEASVDKTRSVFWDTEIVIRALRNQIKIKEIPIYWKEAQSSSLTFRREIKMLPYIIKFWFRSLNNKKL